MNTLFYLAAAVAILATLLVITRAHAVHALLYLIVSLLAAALAFFLLGAPFAAALEVIVYAGAIMVLFVFVVMMLNLGTHSVRGERQWLRPAAWVGPGLLAAVFLAELVYVLGGWSAPATTPAAIGPREVGLARFGPYVLAVELASVMLLAGLVGAYHLARPQKEAEGEA